MSVYISMRDFSCHGSKKRIQSRSSGLKSGVKNLWLSLVMRILEKNTLLESLLYMNGIISIIEKTCAE